MTLLIQGRRKQYVCDKCDADPLRSPTIKKLMEAVKPPKGA